MRYNTNWTFGHLDMDHVGQTHGLTLVGGRAHLWLCVCSRERIKTGWFSISPSANTQFDSHQQTQLTN